MPTKPEELMTTKTFGDRVYTRYFTPEGIVVKVNGSLS